MPDPIFTSEVALTRKWFQWCHHFAFDNAAVSGGVSSATFLHSMTPVENDVYKFDKSVRQGGGLTVIYDTPEKWEKIRTCQDPLDPNATLSLSDAQIYALAAQIYMDEAARLPAPE